MTSCAPAATTARIVSATRSGGPHTAHRSARPGARYIASSTAAARRRATSRRPRWRGTRAWRSRSGRGRGRPPRAPRGRRGPGRRTSSADEDPAPTQPSPRRAARRSAGSRPAPNQIGGPWRVPRLGLQRRVGEAVELAVEGRLVAGPQRAHDPRRPRSSRRTGRSTGKPSAATSSSAGAPRPTPTVIRPPDRRSSEASSFASSTGWRRAITITAMPSRISRVTAAANDSTCRPSSSGQCDSRPAERRCRGPRAREPEVSARCAYATIGRGSSASIVWGRPTEKRGASMAPP